MNKTLQYIVEAFIKMCTNFLLIVTDIVYFTDQNFIILLKIRHFLLKSDLTILNTEYSEKIRKNHFPIKFSVNCDHLKVLVSFGFLFHSLQTNNFDQTNNN